MTDRQKAFNKLQQILAAGISEEEIVNHLIRNHLSGSQALEAMESCEEEFDLNQNDEDETED